MLLISTPCVFPVLSVVVVVPPIVDEPLLSVVDPPVDEPSVLSVVVVDSPPVDEPLLSVVNPPVDEPSLLSVVVDRYH